MAIQQKKTTQILSLFCLPRAIFRCYPVKFFLSPLFRCIYSPKFCVYHQLTNRLLFLYGGCDTVPTTNTFHIKYITLYSLFGWFDLFVKISLRDAKIIQKPEEKNFADF